MRAKGMTCSVDGCSSSVHGLGLCKRHYNASRRTENLGGCQVGDCGKAHYARGWCYMHYCRWRKHGDPLKVTLPKERRHPPTTPISDRFWSKVEKTDSCWLWRGATHNNGYGSFAVDGRRDSHRHACAHRVAYELVVGPIPDGLVLDHLCRNPSCVNPDHLEPVTQAVNLERGLKPRNQFVGKDVCLRGHVFTPENTYFEPRRPGKRVCRECKRIRDRQRRKRVAGAAQTMLRRGAA